MQAAAAVLLAVILTLVLEQNGKDMAAVLSIVVCCLIIGVVLSYLRPVLIFLQQLESIGNFSGEMFGILFKTAGIGIVSEVAAMVCADAGKASFGKGLQLAGTAVILWLSIPIFSGLLDLVQSILEEV